MRISRVDRVREGEAPAEPLSHCVYPGAPGLSASFALPLTGLPTKLLHSVAKSGTEIVAERSLELG